MKQKFTHTVPDNYSEKVRITDYAIGLFPHLLTKNAVKKAIKRKQLLINKIHCSTADFVKSEQIIEFRFQDVSVHKKFKLKLDILFEDDFLAVVNKPAGIRVSGNTFKTLKNALPFNLKLSNQKDALPCPLPVHRLDSQTSGLVIIAKTSKSQIILGQQFENKLIKKIYFAVVIGKTPKEGTIDLPVDSKNAYTEFELVETKNSFRNSYLSLIKLTPQTGRTHQLRIHCEASGFPILGDKIYFGKNEVFKGKGLFLAACELKFWHPSKNENIQISIHYPKKFDTIMLREKKRFEIKK